MPAGLCPMPSIGLPSIGLQLAAAMRPTLDYDGIYGSTTGSWTTEMFIEAAYTSLKQAKN